MLTLFLALIALNQFFACFFAFDWIVPEFSGGGSSFIRIPLLSFMPASNLASFGYAPSHFGPLDWIIPKFSGILAHLLSIVFSGFVSFGKSALKFIRVHFLSSIRNSDFLYSLRRWSFAFIRQSIFSRDFTHLLGFISLDKGGYDIFPSGFTFYQVLASAIWATITAIRAIGKITSYTSIMGNPKYFSFFPILFRRDFLNNNEMGNKSKFCKGLNPVRSMRLCFLYKMLVIASFQIIGFTDIAHSIVSWVTQGVNVIHDSIISQWGMECKAGIL